MQFLDELLERLRPVGVKDREALLALKKEEHAKNGFPFDGEFYLWDYRCDVSPGFHERRLIFGQVLRP